MKKDQLFCKSTPADLAEFKASVTRCLEALTKRSQQGYDQFLNPDLDFHAILPMGEFHSVADYRKTHQAWFTKNTGSFSYVFERFFLAGDLGSVVMRADYKNVDGEGKPFHKHLVISNLFQRVGGRWYLIYNQNTQVNATT